MDFGRGQLVPYPDLLEELIALVREDAEELGCLAEVEYARNVVASGTSADRQVATYRARLWPVPTIRRRSPPSSMSGRRYDHRPVARALGSAPCSTMPAPPSKPPSPLAPPTPMLASSRAR